MDAKQEILPLRPLEFVPCACLEAWIKRNDSDLAEEAKKEWEYRFNGPYPKGAT